MEPSDEVTAAAADAAPAPARDPIRSWRRSASAAEARALASPVRVRILRLCFDEDLTNEQLASALGRDPATVLHHVRTLVRTGFLRPAEPRPGPRGSTERPYRATGKSWTVEVTDPQYEAKATHAVVDAFFAEARDIEPPDFAHVTRAALRLSPADREEMGLRLQAVIEEYMDRPTDPAGEPWAVFLTMHRRYPAGGPVDESSDGPPTHG